MADRVSAASGVARQATTRASAAARRMLEVRVFISQSLSLRAVGRHIAGWHGKEVLAHASRRPARARRGVEGADSGGPAIA